MFEHDTRTATLRHSPATPAHPPVAGGDPAVPPSEIFSSFALLQPLLPLVTSSATPSRILTPSRPAHDDPDAVLRDLRAQVDPQPDRIAVLKTDTHAAAQRRRREHVRRAGCRTLLAVQRTVERGARHDVATVDRH